MATAVAVLDFVGSCWRATRPDQGQSLAMYGVIMRDLEEAMPQRDRRNERKVDDKRPGLLSHGFYL